VEHHLEALRRQMPDLLRVYSILGEGAAEVGVQKGTLDAEGRKRILEMLTRHDTD